MAFHHARLPTSEKRPPLSKVGVWPLVSDRWPGLLAYDAAHVWHPYSSLPAGSPPLAVESASGVRLRLADGRELVDGMASWWTAIHGYRHPALDAALTTQLGRMAHVMFGGLTHEPAIELARRLVELTPAGLEHVFFADSGSVSVEVALKMCLQYWRSSGDARRTKVLALRGGYHGDTFGAMSLCDPDGGMHSLWRGVLAEQVFAERPPAGADAPVDDRYVDSVRSLVERHSAELAAVFAEPVVQGAGGMHFYAPGYVRALRQICDEFGLLLVLDEIATGFGRTGTLFAADAAGTAPDVMCVGKGLTGGYLSFAATMCSSRVASGICAGSAGVLMHGPTYMANPLACAVALASTGLLLDGSWHGDVRRIEDGLRVHLAPAADLAGVRDVRVLGAIGVLELNGPVDVPAATDVAARHGVYLRPFRNLVYMMPPYITGPDDVRRIAEAAVAAAASQQQ